MCTVGTFFDRMLSNFKEGNYAKVAEVFVLPCAIYFQADVIVVSDRARMQEILQRQCDRNIQLGVRAITYSVPAQSYSRRNNYSVWVTWNHFDRHGDMMFASNIRYFCRDSPEGTPTIQLLEFLEIPACFSEEEVQEMAQSSARSS